jgi:hypothetical protein
LPARRLAASMSGATNDDRRTAVCKGRARSKHPVLAGLLLAVADKPKNSGTRAWGGAHGEEVFAASLDRLAAVGLYFPHDRRIPPTRANIDHIVIAPSGVYVIDAKNYTGRAQLIVTGGLFTPRVEKLKVGQRDCTKLVAGVHKQVDRVSELLDREHRRVRSCARDALLRRKRLAPIWRLIHRRRLGGALANEGTEDHDSARPIGRRKASRATPSPRGWVTTRVTASTTLALTGR